MSEFFVGRAREDGKWYVFVTVNGVGRALEGPFKTKREAEAEKARYSIQEMPMVTPRLVKK